jgi:anti-anti-sigma factor
METSVKEVADVTVLLFEGELDTNTSTDAENQLNELIKNETHKILLDFAKLDFISSAGLRVLLATAQQLKIAGGGLRVCSLNKDVKEVFDISGFSTLLSVFDNEAEALNGF